jgi:hypothetical protein
MGLIEKRHVRRRSPINKRPRWTDGKCGAPLKGEEANEPKGYVHQCKRTSGDNPDAERLADVEPHRRTSQDSACQQSLLERFLDRGRIVHCVLTGTEMPHSGRASSLWRGGASDRVAETSRRDITGSSVKAGARGMDIGITTVGPLDQARHRVEQRFT